MEEKVLVAGSSFEELKSALRLCYQMFVDHKVLKGINYFKEVDDPKTKSKILYLFCTKSANSNEMIGLPAPLSSEIMSNIIWEWLSPFKANQGSGDGSYEKGWEIEARDFYNVADYPCISVKPITLYYGK